MDQNRLTSYQIQMRQWWSELRNHHNHMQQQCHKLSRCGGFPKFVSNFLPKVYAQDASFTPGQKTVAEKLAEHKPKIVISDQDVEDYIAKETGMDRLKDMFKKGDDLSPELEYITFISMNSSWFAFLLFGFIGGIQAKEKFIRENKHTKFLTRFRASRSYNDAILKGAVLSGLKMGTKVFFFSGATLLICQSIATYRNKSSVLEYVGAGAVICSVLRLNLGLKGFVAGGVIGSVLGLISGCLIYGTLWMNGDLQEQRHYSQVYNYLQKTRETRLLQNPNDTEILQT